MSQQKAKGVGLLPGLLALAMIALVIYSIHLLEAAFGEVALYVLAGVLGSVIALALIAGHLEDDSPN